MNAKPLIAALKGAGIGILVTVLLLAVGNVIALQTADPVKTVSLLAHVIRLIGGFSAGLAAARFLGEKAIGTGALAGGLYTAVLLIGAAITAGDFAFLPALLLGLATVAAAAVGGLAGRRGEASPRAKRKAMMKRMGR
jgi:putative membrane protein (TIGR04086 family)